MANKKYTDELGNIIKIKGTPKHGGEGDVFEIEGRPDLVIKIYNDKKKKDPQAYESLINKVRVMCDMCDNSIMQRAGWPQKIVYHKNKPVGFVMNKIKYSNSFHQLADALDRKEKFVDNNWKYMVLVAHNLACAIDTLHQKDIVIGDINESNFLIGNRAQAQEDGIFDYKNNGIVYCIDCDSFQILTKKENFLCTVNKPEYLSPELIGVDLHKIIRNKNQDNFGLAVMIFQLLMLGRHPYMGVGTPGNVIESIEKGCFIFGKNAKKKGVYPPNPQGIFEKIYDSLNEDIKLLFERAFDYDLNANRPSAKDWIKALYKQYEDLIQCDSENHFYNKNGNCIWCEIEKEFGGYNPWENKVKLNNSQIAYTFYKSAKNTIKSTKKKVKNNNTNATKQVNQTPLVQPTPSNSTIEPDIVSNDSNQELESAFEKIIYWTIGISWGIIVVIFEFILLPLLKTLPIFCAVALPLEIAFKMSNLQYGVTFAFVVGIELAFKKRINWFFRILIAILLSVSFIFVSNKFKAPQMPLNQPVYEQIKEKDTKEVKQISEEELSAIKNKYLDDVIQKVKDSIVVPAGFYSGSAKAEFKIARNGQLLSYEISEVAGNYEVDNVIIQALESATPFKPFPKEIENNFVNITYVFNVSKK